MRCRALRAVAVIRRVVLAHLPSSSFQDPHAWKR